MVDQGTDGPAVLLGFRAENVRSFRDRLELSMLSTALSEPTAVRQVPWRTGGKPMGVLPTAGIFGANASGKTNVLRALDDMRGFVLWSFRRGDPAGGMPQRPFRLDPETEHAPSSFEVDLILNGVRHVYGFKLDRERVLEEWAYRYPHGRPALLFNRDGDHVEVGAAERTKSRAVTELLRPNALFLSTAASANHPVLLPIYEWFQRNLLLAEAESRELRQVHTTQLLQDDARRAQVLALLRAADLGITGANLREVDPTTRERFERAAPILAGLEDNPDGGELALELGGFEIYLEHRGSKSNVELHLSEESLGTLVWFGLVGPVIDALAEGSVLLADELDASLHPALVSQLIRLFQQPETNPRRAQLIFNSHDVTVMGGSKGERLLGRDQIWFTEKLDDGSTRLYPLTDLDPRKDEAVARRYLSGRYGATPIISPPEFDQAAELITAGVAGGT